MQHVAFPLPVEHAVELRNKIRRRIVDAFRSSGLTPDADDTLARINGTVADPTVARLNIDSIVFLTNFLLEVQQDMLALGRARNWAVRKLPSLALQTPTRRGEIIKNMQSIRDDLVLLPSFDNEVKRAIETLRAQEKRSVRKTKKTRK